MGTAARLSHHVLISKRRVHRRRSTLRRHPTWPVQAVVREVPPDGPTMALSALHDAPMSHAWTLGPRAGDISLGALLIEARDDDATIVPSVLDMPLAALRWGDPLRWLIKGWHDFARAPAIGLFFGACFVLMGWLLLGTFEYAPKYTLALSAGFLLMGPFLCLGLYEVSRQLGQGRQPRWRDALFAWWGNRSQLAIFAGVLMVLEMLWGRSAMIVFAISFDGVPDFGAPLATLLTEEYLVFFAAYGAVCAIFASLIYAISAISVPMMLDRSVDAISAGLTSLRLVSTQTGVMALWGVMVGVGVLLAMLPGFMGLLVAAPVLGHASWHAYRAATGPAA
jgi:uncharacterized membrane protein